jgi:hypothetical protein
MHISEAIDLIIKATRSHLHVLDEEGCCEESDDYVVALYVFENWVEGMRLEEEKEAIREGEWNSDFHREDKYDHIEEKARDHSLGEQEAQIRNDEVHCFQYPF